MSEMKFLLMAVGDWPDNMDPGQKDKAVCDFITALETAAKPFEDAGIKFESLRMRVEQKSAFPL